MRFRIKHLLLLQLAAALLSIAIEPQSMPRGLFLRLPAAHSFGAWWDEKYLVVGLYEDHNRPLLLMQMRPQAAIYGQTLRRTSN